MTIKSLSSYALPRACDLPKDKVDWNVALDKAVLLIHDMQDYFVGFYSEDNTAINQVIENIRRIKQYCKAHGVPVIYTAQPPEQSDCQRGLLNDMWGHGLTRQPEKAGIVAPLQPDEDDRVLTKWRYSAFFRSPLAEIMAQQGRDQIIICGIYGHIGVLQTATDAFMQDFKPFLVADAICDFSREDQIMALNYVARNAGRTLLCTDIILPTNGLSPSIATLSKESLRARLGELLDDEPQDHDDLIDFGLDSVSVMELIGEWKTLGIEVDFAELAQAPTIDGWWKLLREKQSVGSVAQSSAGIAQTSPEQGAFAG